MKAITEPVKVTAPNALGQDSTCTQQVFEIEADDPKERDHYLGFNHRRERVAVGEQIRVYSHGAWTCWTRENPPRYR